MKNGEINKLSLLTNQLFNITGRNLHKDSVWINALSLTVEMSMVLIFILGVMEPITHELNFELSIEYIELIGPFFQTLTKIIIHKLSINTIRKILREMDENFWPSNKFGRKLKIEQNKVINSFYRWPVCLIIGFEASVVFIFIKPMFYEKRTVPFKCYEIWSYDEHLSYYLFIYITQAINMYMGPLIVIGSDTLFADLISRIICQMMMLRKGIETLNLNKITTDKQEEECYEKVKEYVDHHCMLLRMLNDIKNIYSFILLYKIIAISVTLIGGMYTVVVASDNLILVGRAVCLALAFLFQLTVYCLAGSFIEDECGKLSTSAFNSGWHECRSKKLKQTLQMIIIRSQKPQILSAGSIIYANLNGYSKILHFSISVYTLIKNKRIN